LEEAVNQENILVVKSAIKGNKDAFTTLIHQYKKDLYKIAYMYTKNEDDAFEAIDEAVYKAYISIKKLKDPNFFKTWITKILINECINILRKKNKIVLEDNNLNHEVAAMDLNLNCDYEELYKAINTLNDKQKMAITLKYFDDLKTSTIAERMKVPENTVKSYIRRGISSLRNTLRGDVFL